MTEQKERRWWRQDGLPVALLVVSVVLYYAAFMAGHVYGWDDLLFVFYPGANFFAKSLAAGHFPFWIPGQRVGMPFYSDIQMGVFYPFHWLLIPFVKEGRLPIGVYQTFVAAHYLVGGVLMYVFLRLYKLARYACLCGALVFIFSAYVTLHLILVPFALVALWAPLQLIFIKRYVDERRPRDLLYLTLAVLISFLPGSPQITVYISYFVIGYWLFAVLSRAGQEGLRSWALGRLALIELCKVVAVFVGAILLGSILFLPAYENWKWSQRAAFGYAKIADTSMPWYYTLQMFFPNIFGVMNSSYGGEVPFWGFNRDSMGFARYRSAYWHFWDLGSYAGQLGILALLYVLFRWRSLQRRELCMFGLLSAILALWFMAGRYGGLFGLLYKVLPGISMFRAPGRMACVLNLAMALLAASLVDMVLRDEEHRRSILRFSLACLGLYALFALGLWLWGSAFHEMLARPKVLHFALKQVAWGIGLLAALVLLFFWLGRSAPSSPLRLLLSIALCALVFVDLYTAYHYFHQGKTSPAVYYHKHKKLFERIAQMRKEQGPFRLIQIKRGKLSSLVVAPRNIGYFYDNIEVPEGYVLFELAQVNKLRSSAPLRTLVPLLNAGIVAYGHRGRALFRQIQPLFGKTRFYTKAQPFPDHDAIYRALKKQSIDIHSTLPLQRKDCPRFLCPPQARNSTPKRPTSRPSKAAVASRPSKGAVASRPSKGAATSRPSMAAVASRPSKGAVASRLRFSALHHNAFQIHYRVEKPGILFVSQSYYPGWQAVSAKGTRLKVIPVFGALTGIVLPKAGEGIVTVRFAPPIFRLALGLNAVAWLVFVLLFVWTRKRSN